MLPASSILKRSRWAGMALLALLVAPGVGRAEFLILRNDAPMPVVIHITAVFQGRVQRSPPLFLKPKLFTTGINLMGDKQVIIVDASTPTRILFNNTIPGTPFNKAFSIQPNPPNRVRLQQIPFPGPK